MEERAESIDDGSFETAETGPAFPNIPTDYHDKAATVGFGDGHVDVRRWRNPYLTTVQQEIVHAKLNGSGATVTATDPDWVWLSQHASKPK
jgi:prepilin-type processing-associated H-X9-DG protein